MRGWVTAVALVAMMVCWGANAMASTFFVAMTGEDGGAGTEARPWRTLQHAVDTIGPGIRSW